MDLRAGVEAHGEEVAFLVAAVESIGKLPEVADRVFAGAGMMPAQDETREVRDDGVNSGTGRHRFPSVEADA